LTLLLVALAVCYLWALGHPPLLDPDEPVYAETGRIMAISHSLAAWWSPHYDGSLWFDKPPVTYWLIGLSMSVFGPTEFAARFPSVLAALALAWLTARLCWHLFPSSRNAPLWAAGIVGTCLQSLILAHASTTDMIFVAALTAAVLKAWTWLKTGRKIRILWCGVATGVAVMVKGPVAIVLVGLALLIFLVATKQAKRLLDGWLWLALLLTLVVAAPWYASMVVLHGRYFITSFLEAQNVGRYLTAEHQATASPLFFIPVLIAGFLPWTFPLAPAIVACFRRAKAGEQAGLFCLIWIALVFLFFSASQSKLITYIFPLYPLAACVTGYWIAEEATEKAIIICLTCWGVVASGLDIYLCGQRDTEAYVWPLAAQALWISALFPLIFFFVAMRTRRDDPAAPKYRKRYDAADLVYPAMGFALFFAIVWSSPHWNHPDPKNVSAVDVGRTVATLTRPGDTVYSLTLLKPSIVFYSQRRIFFTDRQQYVARAMQQPPYPICVTKNDIVEQLLAKHLLAQYKYLSRIGKVVVLIQYQPPARGGPQGEQK
jgi:4-amino-4-deoxy-L-arabinose transferase-like glycosyltransferase